MKNPFMARAIKLAIENVRVRGGGPFAALVLKDGEVISDGANCVTSTNDPTAHAEVMAIRKACGILGVFELRGCDIYTSCEPCPMCLGAIYWARPERVFFACTSADASKAGFDDSLIYQELTLAHARRKIPLISMMRDEALEVFRAWEDKNDKIPY